MSTKRRAALPSIRPITSSSKHRPGRGRRPSSCSAISTCSKQGSSRRISLRSRSRGRPRPKCGSGSSGTSARPRRFRNSIERAGWRSVTGSARSRSARSTRSACRCCVNFLSKPTSIRASTWPTRQKSRDLSRSPSTARCECSRGSPNPMRTLRSYSRSWGPRERARAWRCCCSAASLPATRSIDSSPAVPRI